jgi:hypothetical protein
LRIKFNKDEACAWMRRIGSRVRVYLLVVAALCLVLVAIWAFVYLGVPRLKELFNQKVSTGAVTASETQQVARQELPPSHIRQVSSTVNPITLAAVQSGILGGASRINQVTAFLAGDNPAGAVFFPQAKEPDKHVFSLSMEILSANANANSAKPVYATASFSPNLVGGWDAVYDTVEYIDSPVEQVMSAVFAGAVPSKISRDILVYESGDAKFFLMPAGRGSVLIKKEVVR